ncbi:MAG: hypothetical protein V7K92_26335 [Nostoc sp.]|uniref:hypothetical protein n=1 Tax=Nostoc sp. TaxID=1180 RepID=UPI002FF091BF
MLEASLPVETISDETIPTQRIHLPIEILVHQPEKLIDRVHNSLALLTIAGNWG